MRKFHTWWVQTCEHKKCGRCNVRKHRDIKDRDKYIALNIVLKFVSVDKMKITSSEPKDYLGRPGKGFITSLGLKTNVRSKQYKKASYDITNISIKDLSKIIKEFEKLPYKGYVTKSPKHEPNNSYLYLARQIYNFMMRSDALKLHVDPIRTEMTGMQQIPILHICDSYESESKEIFADKKSSQVCSTDEGES